MAERTTGSADDPSLLGEARSNGTHPPESHRNGSSPPSENLLLQQYLDGRPVKVDGDGEIKPIRWTNTDILRLPVSIRRLAREIMATENEQKQSIR